MDLVWLVTAFLGKLGDVLPAAATYSSLISIVEGEFHIWELTGKTCNLEEKSAVKMAICALERCSHVTLLNICCCRYWLLY